jgi:hypothetical protein
MRDMDTYMKALDIIAKVNHIDEYAAALVQKEPPPQFIVATAGLPSQVVQPIPDENNNIDDVN